ncbi:hypothetical protein DBW_2575 [Desulfuromonas sp. DDH964]|uniref:hypothetical protein n=1 Tax=Desulfuromonas sp. DDH964 TaxID=1823759 RepID=UPI00078CEA3B|nr:hypothetical protein [Desulfuromonas sp. DDH964]AMV72903.1 hypothetical protein DBW_2575 [Desulfuromonas sp. DDH964]
MIEMLQNFFQSIGEVQSVFTLVDFYQYIKGVEYLICVAFFISFPMFYRYIHHDDASRKDGH